MRRWMRAHLTFANVASAIALFVALGGGAAYAANTIYSTDIVNDQVKSADVRNDDLADGGLAALDLRPGSVRGSEVQDNSLTGGDIANQSGVDSCTHGTDRFGELCVGVANEQHTWTQALFLCANRNLRLPTNGEAIVLATNYDLPNVDESEYFWTGNQYSAGNTYTADIVSDGGSYGNATAASTRETLCVTTPTN